MAPGTEDENRSPFDAVEQGPEESGGPAGTPRASGDPTEHPSVMALQGRFGSAIVHHEVQAGDQHVVFVDAAQNREVLAWLKDDAEQRYDLLVDVTAVDYGGGRPIQVVYQLWSVPYKRALRVKCELPLEASPSPASYSFGAPRTGSSVKSSTCLASTSRIIRIFAGF